MLRSIPFDMSLRDALGERLRVLPDDCAKYAISGVAPKSVALPRNQQEAALTLAAAAAEGAIVTLRGAGTKSSRPPAPRAVDVVVDTRALAGIVQHEAADLTITVGAATTLAQLDATLAAAGQFWPCDAPFAESATVGGTIAANANGALRFRYGPLRELVLGAQMLTPDGVFVRAGSRVVKSVAGYDIHKLLAGSFGTLGLIVEATLKVASIPQIERVVIGRFSSAVSACAVGRSIAASNLFPMAITLHDDLSARRVGALLAHASHDTWLLNVRCGGNKLSVARQTNDVADACKAGGAEETSVLDGPASRRCATGMAELFGGAHYSTEQFAVLKIASLPTDLALVIAEVRAASQAAEISAQPAGGILFVHLPIDASASTSPPLTAIAGRCRAAGWNSAVLSAPPRICAARFPDPQPSGPARLLRAVKAAFDPAGVLDPGRLPGGV